ncbi:hypothetical protein GHT06_021593 [Daphnia sinensis]|uniref:Uncharacterized protein n=1 Tax=Daphnia sinensis TaxID=1820382 RepID=A0AAD5PN08_9CRUS|nr:hypothetical protein GHT06_021593 [Daphnia sinensis]
MIEHRKILIPVHFIYYNIEPTYQTSIEGSATSAEMWNRLAQEYAQVAVANSSQIIAKFFQYLMDPGHTMAEELKSVEAPVTDQQLIERILQTLPPSYYNFISAWESVPLAERSISSLTSRLILEETRMKSRTNGPNPTDIAFFASHPNNKQQQAVDCNSANAYAASKSYNGVRGGYPGLRVNRGSSSGYRGGYRGGNNGFHLLINDFDGDEEKVNESCLFDPLLLTTEILGLLEPVHDVTQEVEEMAAENVQDHYGVIHDSVVREDEAIVENDAQEILHAAPLLHVEMEEENDDQNSGIMENDPLIPINELDEDNEIPAQRVEQPIEFPRRSSRPKQYNAKYKEFRQSLGRPLAKIGLIGCTAINCKMIGKLKPAYEGVPEPCTALSTTEAEYISACEAAKTAVWLRAVRLVYNAEFHQRTKHIQLRWHWIREQAANEIIEVKFVGTENQLADIFTKALAGPVFHNMRRRIGVGKLSD